MVLIRAFLFLCLGLTLGMQSLLPCEAAHATPMSVTVGIMDHDLRGSDAIPCHEAMPPADQGVGTAGHPAPSGTHHDNGASHDCGTVCHPSVITTLSITNEAPVMLRHRPAALYYEAMDEQVINPDTPPPRYA